MATAAVFRSKLVRPKTVKTNVITKLKPFSDRDILDLLRRRGAAAKRKMKFTNKDSILAGDPRPVNEYTRCDHFIFDKWNKSLPRSNEVSWLYSALKFYYFYSSYN